MKRPRILFLAPKAPYPLTSGLAMRQFHLLRAYSSIASVDLAFFAGHDRELVEVCQGVGSYCERIHAIPFPPVRKPGTFGPWLGWKEMIHPLLIRGLDSCAIRRFVADSAESTDLIHVSRLYTANAVEALLDGRRRRPRLILDLDDVETVAQWRLLRHSRSRRWVYRAFRYCDLVRLFAYQHRTVRQFDRVFVCSEHDRMRLGRPNVVVVPNGFDAPHELPRRGEDPDAKTLLFCGLLSYGPNEDAVLFFVRSILPAIRQKLPDARFVVVGTSPSASLRALDNGVSVRIEANVPTVADYYRAATVAVVPLRMGGGTRIKILEAWALGLPVISTSIGCEGLEGVDGEHLIVANTPRQFAEACVELLQSPSRREALARSGRDLVMRKYRWETSTNKAMLAVREVLNLRDPAVPDPGTTDPCLA
jgi:polysaccharide biosynthesis protein PslH